MHDSRSALSPHGLSGATTALLIALLSACGSSPSAGGGTGGPPPASGAAGSAGTAGATIPAGGSGGSSASGGAAGSVAASTGGSSPGHTGGSAGTGTGGAAGNGGAATGGGAGRATGGGGAAGAGGAGGDAAACPLHGSLPATSWAVRLANAVLARWPDPADLTTTAGWEYNHGIVLRGLQQVWNHTCDPRYVAYIQKYADENVSAAGVVNIPASHSFDNIQPSVLLPFLFQRTGLAKYRTAADQIRARYDTIPTNADGGFWHKQAYPNQMWLDSMYMGEPFLGPLRRGVRHLRHLLQATRSSSRCCCWRRHVRDLGDRFLYHAWDDSPAGKKVELG